MVLASANTEIATTGVKFAEGEEKLPKVVLTSAGGRYIGLILWVVAEFTYKNERSTLWLWICEFVFAVRQIYICLVVALRLGKFQMEGTSFLFDLMLSSIRKNQSGCFGFRGFIFLTFNFESNFLDLFLFRFEPYKPICFLLYLLGLSYRLTL